MPNDDDFNQNYPPIQNPNPEPQPLPPVTPVQPAPNPLPEPNIPPTTNIQQNTEQSHFVDKAEKVFNTTIKIRVAISIVSVVVMLIVLAIIMLSTRTETNQKIEAAKPEQVVAEEREEKRKTAITLKDKTFYIYPSFEKTIRGALDNDIKITYLSSKGFPYKEKKITKDNVDDILNMTLGKFSGTSYDMADISFSVDDSSNIDVMTIPSSDEEMLKNLSVYSAETELFFKGSVKIDNKELTVGATTYDEFKDMYGRLVCEIENYSLSGGKTKEETNYSAQIYKLDNGNIIVGVFKKDNNNTLDSIRVDYTDTPVAYCPD